MLCGSVSRAGVQLQLWMTWIRSPARVGRRVTVTDAGRAFHRVLLGGEPAGQVGGEGRVRHGADGGDPTLAVLAGDDGGELAEVRMVVADDHLRAVADQPVDPVGRGAPSDRLNRVASRRPLAADR